MTDFIGTRISVPGSTRGFGTLRYVGSIDGKPGTFGGIELQGPIAASRGKNNGAVNGKQYFDVVQPMSGLFLPWERLREANSKLPQLDGPGSRVSSISSQEIMNTPSPKNRDTPLRLGSRSSDAVNRFQNSASRNGTRNGRESPYATPQPLHVQKRMQRTSSPDPYRARSVVSTGSRNSLGDVFDQSRNNHEVELLQRELNESRMAINSNAREIQEKNLILDNLQKTIHELQPVLEDYEKDLMDKERKIAKQRTEYDRAREEWRQSLDLMLSAQQESETLYELQIEDLKDEIKRLDQQKGASEAQSTEVLKLTDQVKDLAKENQLLKEKIASQSSRSLDDTKAEALSNDDQTEYIELLKKKVKSLTQDVDSINFVMEQLQAKSKAKDTKIVELEIELDEIKENMILENVGSMSVQDWQEKEIRMGERIDELEKQLKKSKALYEETNQKLNSSTSAHSEISEKLEKALAFQQEAPELHDAELAANIRTLEVKLSESELTNRNISQQINVLEERLEGYTTRESELVEQLKAAQVKAQPKVQPEDSSLLQTIEDLKHELAMRPSFDELTELQTSLEEVDRLHQSEIGEKEQALAKAHGHNDDQAKEIERLRKELEASKKWLVPTPLQVMNLRSPSKPLVAPLPPSGSLPDPESWVEDDVLGIYTPTEPVDPSRGRADWCGLCEKEGHNSLNCPYENDLF